LFVSLSHLHVRFGETSGVVSMTSMARSRPWPRTGGDARLQRVVPSRLKSLRHSRTVSARTPNASAMRGLVQPESVSRMARALSASPRSREPARAARAERWSSLAEIGDLPLIPHLCKPTAIANRTQIRWSRWRRLLRDETDAGEPNGGNRCNRNWSKRPRDDRHRAGSTGSPGAGGCRCDRGYARRPAGEEKGFDARGR